MTPSERSPSGYTSLELPGRAWREVFSLPAEQLAQRIIRRCAGEGLRLATAESLTAGLCASTLAGVPGASAVLRGGVIVYATELKASLAGVDPELLRRRGPVDPEVAAQLARGAATRCDAELGIGLTGVAGPEPQDGHPVGEIYIGVHHAADAAYSGGTVGGHTWVLPMRRNPNWGTSWDSAARARHVIREDVVKAACVAVEEALRMYASGNKAQP